MTNRLNERNNSFQSTIFEDNYKNQKEKYTSELRKTKRLENSNKRRAIILDDETEAHYISESIRSAFPQLADKYLDSRVKLESYYYILTHDFSYEDQYSALFGVRKILAATETIPSKQAAEIGYIQLFVNMLDSQNTNQVLLESL